ncbi:MAG: adenine nucleotide alpha hydrolase family protein [Anaerolineales bacterium]|nr:adenine nucleotide alpha hydrolase family protein [Anaerolineales bacterium]
MKCRICGRKAAVNMRQHKLALCRDDFLEWVPQQVERFIQKYKMFTREERVLVAVSGGKDSLGLWDILIRLGYRADGVYIGLGIDEGIAYSGKSQELCEKFSSNHGLTLHVVDIRKEYGHPVPVMSELSRRGKGKPCAVCGLVKRHVMNRAAREMGYDVLVTGHNLDDEAAVLFANTLHWEGEYLLRQGPLLPGREGLVRKVKPLCRIYEKEMAAYTLLRDIDYIYEECPFAAGSTTTYYKELLNKLENDHPGSKMTFYVKFLKSRQSGLFVEKEKIQQSLHPCPNCGQLTSTDDLCSFCRMIDKISQ